MRATLSSPIARRPEPGVYPDRWLCGTGLKPDASAELICVGAAGSGGSQFLPWNVTAPPWLRVLGVQLPGREFRHNEPLCGDLGTLARGIAGALAARPLPFVVFGHSFGALLAFESVLHLQRDRAALPRRLVVAGRPAPHVAQTYPPLPPPSQPEFIALLRSFGGTDPRLLDDPQRSAHFLPAIHADLCLNLEYRSRLGPLLEVPLVALRGIDDPVCDHAQLCAWADVPAQAPRIEAWAGTHFFHLTALRRLLALCAEPFAADVAAVAAEVSGGGMDHAANTDASTFDPPDASGVS